MSIGQKVPAITGYEPFYGFVEPPFSLSVNTRFRYDSTSHHEALSHVAHALERREPIVVVTGEIGTGKTLLCRTVVERLPRKAFLSVIHDPMLGRDDLLKRILEDFGVISSTGAGLVQTSRHELVHALQKFLASLAQLEAHAVVILDEAQHVRADVLEEIRLLANVHDSRGTLLQIILVGQPSLRLLLDTPELAQLRQRITRFVSLEPLTGDEVRQYMTHRLTVARAPHTNSTVPGASDLASALAQWNDDSSQPVGFADEAVASVARISRGVPREVNLLCDRALETAYTEQTRTVSASHVRTAATLLHMPAAEDVVAAAPSMVTAAAPSPLSPSSRSPRRLVAAAATVAVVAAIVWLGAAAMRTPRTGGQPAATTASAPPQGPPSVDRPSPPPVDVPQRGAESTPAQSAPPAPTVSAAPPITTASAGGFEILVASFRTDARATAVAKEIAAMGQKVRQRSLGGWHQVLAGPFSSRADANEVQEQLNRAGVTGTVIVPEK